MPRIIVVTHGPLAEGFKECCRLFFGDKADEISVFGLYANQSMEELKKRIEDYILKENSLEGYLILVDIFAGSPFNAMALIIDELKEKYKMECFTGVNMPILMEALAGSESMTLDEMVKHLEEIIPSTISNLRKELEI